MLPSAWRSKEKINIVSVKNSWHNSENEVDEIYVYIYICIGGPSRDSNTGPSRPFQQISLSRFGHVVIVVLVSSLWYVLCFHTRTSNRFIGAHRQLCKHMKCGDTVQSRERTCCWADWCALFRSKTAQSSGTRERGTGSADLRVCLSSLCC